MSFAETYLERYASGSVGTLSPPHPDVFFIVVIPVYDEPDLANTLQSILGSQESGYSGEIILVINRPEDATESAIIANMKAGILAKQIQASLLSDRWTVLILEPDPFPVSKAGPGLARKIGMDEAVRRFDQLNRQDGIIISLDADTTVANNYFFILGKNIQKHKSIGSYTCYFEHPIDNNAQPDAEVQGIMEYEIYLRTVKLCLSWAGFPMSIHSLGSAFGVRAQTYVKVGGMGVQQSGEDFYFLQKCLQLGGVWEMNSIKVYPSARTSDRVIFGTGVFVKEYRDKQLEVFNRYSWQAFQDLRAIIIELDSITFSDHGVELELNRFIRVSDLLESLGWKQKIQMARARSGSEKSFKKWQWREIDGFQMVRFLNEHQKKFGAQAITDTAKSLLHVLSQEICSEGRDGMLNLLRVYEQRLGDY
ncbi:MAG: hypothetical protein J7L96_04770, partial [Bacteroidales bacterium]|nr:hypothetical protein [Bacteroidales bacterium]